jgi:hypothetical protein
MSINIIDLNEVVLPGCKPLGAPKAMLFISQSKEPGVKPVDNITVTYHASSSMYSIDVDGIVVDIPSWMFDEAEVVP